MTDNIGEFFINLNNIGELEKNPSILILELPNESQLKLGHLPKIDNVNQIFVLATTVVSNGYLEIKIGTRFDLIFPSKEIDDFVECSAILKYVNVNPRHEINHLPGGYTGICLLEFQNEIPDELLNKLATYDEKRDKLKHDTLILTQQDVLNKLLKGIKTAE